MASLKRLSSTLVLMSLTLAFGGVVSVHGAPERQNTLSNVTQTQLLSSLLNIVNTIGDDLFATADLTTLVDPSTTMTQHYGPYASGSTDSSTCGSDWANDLFNRFFTVFTKTDGSIVVVEQFRDGSFSTPASDSPTPNPSPGACQTTVLPAGYVSNGVTGQLHGYFIIPLPPGNTQTSHSPFCNAVGGTNTDCTTTSFVDSHFSPGCGPVFCPDIVTTFFFHYTAPITNTGANSALIQNAWKNASTNRGGNSGDIRSCNAPTVC